MMPSLSAQRHTPSSNGPGCAGHYLTSNYIHCRTHSAGKVNPFESYDPQTSTSPCCTHDYNVIKASFKTCGGPEAFTSTTIFKKLAEKSIYGVWEYELRFQRVEFLALHRWPTTTVGLPPQMAYHHRWPTTTDGLPPQMAYHHRWPTTTDGLPPQMAYHHRWPTTTDGLPPQVAYHHRWPTITDGLPPQMAYHHRWPTTTDGLPPQMAYHHRWPTTTDGLPPQQAYHHIFINCGGGCLGPLGATGL